MWIEICAILPCNPALTVTSLTEVWIEIYVFSIFCYVMMVTSLAEVWIEINAGTKDGKKTGCHFPRGSVD